MRQPQSNQPPLQQQTPSIDIPEQIRKLAELKDQSILTEEEFQTKKQELLSKM
ncbi:MAG: SHOCT domain-containing protein [Halobacteriota archaeon]